MDIYDFQKKLQDEGESDIVAIVKSYEDIKDELVKNILNGKDVVMEPTLLKAIRRRIVFNLYRKKVRGLSLCLWLT